jgi:hypothetical protein
MSCAFINAPLDQNHPDLALGDRRSQRTGAPPESIADDLRAG